VQDLFDLIPRCSGILINKFTIDPVADANERLSTVTAWRLYVVGQLYKAQDYDPRTRRARRKPMHSLAGPVERPRTARILHRFTTWLWTRTRGNTCAVVLMMGKN
jgi:hypothetical protein